MQKKITFPFDSSDNKLLKKKIYIYQEGILSPKFSLKKNETKQNPGRVKKNHTRHVHI